MCPDGPDQVNAALAASGAQLGRFLDALADVTVVCDVGRLAPGSPALALVAEASAVLMVARPVAEQLQPAARRMLMLQSSARNVGWVLVGQKPYGPAEIEATYGFPVVGVVADDPRSLGVLERGGVSKRIRRHPFVRSSTSLAATLADWLAVRQRVAAAATDPADPVPAAPDPDAAAVPVPPSPPRGLRSRPSAHRTPVEVATTPLEPLEPAAGPAASPGPGPGAEEVDGQDLPSPFPHEDVDLDRVAR